MGFHQPRTWRGRFRLQSIATVVMIACAMSAMGQESEPAQEQAQPFVSQTFKVFPAIYFDPEPQHLERFGLWPTQRLMDSVLWARNQRRDEPNLHYIQWWAYRLDPDVQVFVNIEHWPTMGDPAQVQETVRKFILVADTIHAIQPRIKLGFYGMPPVNVDYGPSQPHDSRHFLDWQRANERLRPIADHVDFILPSLYAYADDQALWERMARAKIEAARQYGKPVYAFLWTRFHDPDNERGLRMKPISMDFWRFQLQLCRQLTDGIYVFDGWDVVREVKMTWQPQAPWWIELQKFIADPANQVTKPPGYEQAALPGQ